MKEFIQLTILILTLISLLRILTFSTFSDLYEIKLSYKKYKGRNKKKPYRPLVSVVIAAYNEEAGIYNTMKSVWQSTYKNFEIIVINDGSKDKTGSEVIRFKKTHKGKRVIYLKQKNAGKGHALNNGLKNKAKGEIVMCLDADSAIRKDALKNAVKYFADPQVVSVATNVKISNANSIIGIIQKLEYTIGFHFKKALSILNIEFIVGGAGSMFRKDILEKCNFYDSNTQTEDIDLTLKIVELGNIENRIVFAEDAVTYTEGPLTFGALLRQRYRWKLGMFQTLLKHKGLFFNTSKSHNKLLTWMYLPYVILREIVSFTDPILFFIIMYYSVLYKDLTSFFAVFLFLAIVTSLIVLSDREETLESKSLALFAAPLGYIWIILVTTIEYISLIKCLLNYKAIVYQGTNSKGSWVPVARQGSNLIS